jgi:hypothetical protein
LPPAEQQAASWQAAAEVLRLVAETGGDPMTARIGMMKALHRREPAAPFGGPRRRRAKRYTVIS